MGPRIPESSEVPTAATGGADDVGAAPVAVAVVVDVDEAGPVVSVDPAVG